MFSFPERMIAVSCLTRSGASSPSPSHSRRQAPAPATSCQTKRGPRRPYHAQPTRQRARLGRMSRGSLPVSSHCLRVYWLRRGCLSPASPYRVRVYGVWAGGCACACACACALWRPPRGVWACGKVDERALAAHAFGAPPGPPGIRCARKRSCAIHGSPRRIVTAARGGTPDTSALVSEPSPWRRR